MQRGVVAIHQRSTFPPDRCENQRRLQRSAGVREKGEGGPGVQAHQEPRVNAQVMIDGEVGNLHDLHHDQQVDGEVGQTLGRKHGLSQFTLKP